MYILCEACARNVNVPFAPAQPVQETMMMIATSFLMCYSPIYIIDIAPLNIQLIQKNFYPILVCIRRKLVCIRWELVCILVQLYYPNRPLRTMAYSQRVFVKLNVFPNGKSRIDWKIFGTKCTERDRACISLTNHFAQCHTVSEILKKHKVCVDKCR